MADAADGTTCTSSSGSMPERERSSSSGQTTPPYVRSMHSDLHFAEPFKFFQRPSTVSFRLPKVSSSCTSTHSRWLKGLTTKTCMACRKSNVQQQNECLKRVRC
eukprot:TRINITY_DN14074_c0_g1_i1.p1 TRINITY_DN14074_c0_g1~~TRINITY_DN14074_c0_g1_i1.p1  ORF type:complete len:118 (-),score=5.40 TRINITY_DN14074_c0_g1_i1:35-346(-)